MFIQPTTLWKKKKEQFGRGRPHGTPTVAKCSSGNVKSWSILGVKMDMVTESVDSNFLPWGLSRNLKVFRKRCFPMSHLTCLIFHFPICQQDTEFLLFPNAGLLWEADETTFMNALGKWDMMPLLLREARVIEKYPQNNQKQTNKHGIDIFGTLPVLLILKEALQNVSCFSTSLSA